MGLPACVRACVASHAFSRGRQAIGKQLEAGKQARQAVSSTFLTDWTGWLVGVVGSLAIGAG